MKAEIKEIVWLREYPSKYKEGEMMLVFKVTYLDENLDMVTAQYTSKHKDQKKFIEGKEAEFTQEEMTGKEGNKYYVIKPIYSVAGNPNYNREKKREQTRYSGFSGSYIKDMLIAGILKPELTPKDIEDNDKLMNTWRKRSYEYYGHLVKLDKSLES